METTWRELLGKVVSDPQEQQRVLNTLNINSMTLRRWINGESNPRPQNLRHLLNAIPQHRKPMIALLAIEFPFIGKENVVSNEGAAYISAEFYGQVMNAYVSVSHHLRSATVSSLILQQLLKQLDPNFDGMLVCVAQCVTPPLSQQIRSLRMISGRGTPPWSTYIEYHPQFFGVESQVGYAVSSGHPTTVQSKEEAMRAFPDDHINGIESSIAAPIVLANQIVGGLYVASTQIDYFTHVNIALIQKYVELMCLAFEKDEYFLLSDISLGVMPRREQQLPYLITFQQRVTQQIVQAARKSDSMTRIQAEKIAWQQLEEELLRSLL